MRISRKEMEAIIDRNESVVIEGEVYTTRESLPSEATLAKGNKEAEKEAKESLKAQMDILKKELASLDEEPEDVIEEVVGEVPNTKKEHLAEEDKKFTSTKKIEEVKK